VRIDILTGGIPDLVIRVWAHLSRRRKRQAALLPVLMLASAFAEVVSLGAVIPFIGILTAPEQVFKYPIVASMARAGGIVSVDQMVLPLTIGFVAAALMAGAMRLLMMWVNVRFSNACGADFIINVYRRTLYQPYRVHVGRNSSEVLSGINKANIAHSVLQNVLVVVSSMILIASIMTVLISINAEVATVAVVGLGVSYGLIIKLSRRRLEVNGQCIARESIQIIKALQEGLGGIRDVLLDGTQSVYCGIYRRSLMPSLRAGASNVIITSSPRLLMEAFGMVLIAILAFHLNSQPGGVAAAMPVLGALVLGAQRMLPAIQQVYGVWATLVGEKASLLDVLKMLDQPLPEHAYQPDPEPHLFEHAIHFDQVKFRYSEAGPWVLDGLDIIIPKGARVGFVGSTGSGKSTTLDLLMGLLEPVQGQILVDSLPITGDHRRAWQRTIAHVPQSIYLADTTLAENIAFGVPCEAIDMERVRQAARQAQIADFIERQSEGYQSFVGERGVRLSGGQRQRIGIARALYKQASVLVFDEATSALDNRTEQAVMDAIQNLGRDLTILVIAHRLTTVRRCDVIIELEHGHVVGQGTYEQLLEASPGFRSMAQVGVMPRP